MLVITRKLYERVFIGDGVSVTIIDVDRNKVKLGIEAPRDVQLWREEIAPAGHPLTKKRPPAKQAA